MCWSIVSMLSSALATGIHSSDALCPIDETDSVKLYFLISGNEFGGYDSDGATYSSGTQYRERIHMQRTLFSAYTEDVQRSFLVQGSLLFKSGYPLAATIDPTVWERYDLAAEYYRWKQSPLYSWANLFRSRLDKVQAVGIHPNLNGPIVADEVLQRGALELSKA